MPHPTQAYPRRPSFRYNTSSNIGGVERFINPEEVLPIPQVPQSPDIPEFTPQSAYSTQAPPTPAMDRYTASVEQSLSAPPPGLGRRIALGALGGAAETMGMQGTAGIARSAMLGIDPRLAAQQQGFANLARLESDKIDNQRRMFHEDVLAKNYQDLVTDRAANRRIQQQRIDDDARDDANNRIRQSQNDMIDARVKGVVDVGEIPRAPSIPPAIPGFPGEPGQSTPGPQDPSYKRFQFQGFEHGDKPGTAKPFAREMAQGPPKTTSNSVFSQRQALLKENEPRMRALMEAAIIDDVPPRQQQVRSAFETAIAAGNDPSIALRNYASQRAVEYHMTGEEFIQAAARKAGLSAGAAAAASRRDPLVTETGEISSYFNPITGIESPAPEGARKTAIPQPQRQAAAVIDNLIENMDNLETLAKSHQEVIGPVSGRVTGAVRHIVNLPTEVQDIFHMADDAGDQLLRARSGAQINEQEYQRLRNLVPNPRGTVSKFFSDLRLFRNEMMRLQQKAGLPSRGREGQGAPSVPGADTSSKSDPLKVR